MLTAPLEKFVVPLGVFCKVTVAVLVRAAPSGSADEYVQLSVPPAANEYGNDTPQSTGAGPTPDITSVTELMVAAIGAGLFTVIAPETA
jgi:hypothetical protein